MSHERREVPGRRDAGESGGAPAPGGRLPGTLLMVVVVGPRAVVPGPSIKCAVRTPPWPGPVMPGIRPIGPQPHPEQRGHGCAGCGCGPIGRIPGITGPGHGGVRTAHLIDGPGTTARG